MSLILDALNKADREREYRDAIPDLKTVHGAPRPTRDYRQFWLVGGLVAALLMVVTLLVIVWLRMPGPVPAPVERDPEATAAPEQIATAPAPATPAPNLPELKEPAQNAAPLAAPVDQEVQALYQTQQDTKVMEVIEPKVQTVSEAPVVITPENPRRSTVDEELARALWEESRREAQQPVPTSALPTTPVTTPVATAKTEPTPLPADVPVEETLAGHSGIPFLHELPVSVQDTIPTLMYAKHEYDKGFVVINKEELNMGSAARGGVLVERILADGVLLSLNGTEFKLSSLSSWVNY